MSAARQQRRPAVEPSLPRELWRRLRLSLVGVGRLCLPGARGVYPPQPLSIVILGAAVPDDVDQDELMRHLWWRGLGLVERSGQLVAGADVTVAVRARRTRFARVFVTRQLRDAGVRGAVKRWEL